jgi:hypothetical protein
VLLVLEDAIKNRQARYSLALLADYYFLVYVSLRVIRPRHHPSHRLANRRHRRFLFSINLKPPVFALFNLENA